MEMHEDHLKKRGWTDEEIADTKKTLGRIQRARHPHQGVLVETVFWTILFLAIATMIAVTYWIVPVFITIPGSSFYPILIIIGLSFGLLFSSATKDLEHLRVHHHIILSSAVPITAIVSFVLVLSNVNDVYVHHNTFLAGALFAFSFLIPHLIEHFS